MRGARQGGLRGGGGLIATVQTPPRPYAEAAKELLRGTIFDGARSLLQERRWSEITMADIASAAGVSRQTLYNEFGSREEFAQAFVLHEGDRFITEVESAIRAHLDDPRRALTGAFDVFLTAAAEDPLVRSAILGPGAPDLLPLVTTQGKPLVERAAERVAEIMVDCWPQAKRSDADLLAECLVRLAISYAALPTGPASMTAASVTTLLGPYIDQALGRP